jgi:hypothetical protein
MLLKSVRQYIILNLLPPTLVIEEANWLTLLDDTAEIFGDGFDAVICLGNSFSHMPDTSGDRQNQRYFCIRICGYLFEFTVIVMTEIRH